MSEHFDILYVEDEAFMHEMVKTFLSEKGYTIKSATSAEEALELYKENNFDILLTDLKLPKMNGVELIKACKNLQPNQKTILITAYTDPEYLVEAINTGVDKFIGKPIDFSRLQETISNLYEQINVSKILEENKNLLLAYRKAVDVSSIFSILDKDGKYTYINNKFLAYSMFDKKDILGKHFYFNRSALDGTPFSDVTKEIDSKKNIWQTKSKNRAKNNSFYFTEVWLIPIYKGSNINGYICIENDITEILKSHNKTIRDIYNSDEAIILMFDKNKKLSFINNKAKHFWKIKNENTEDTEIHIKNSLEQISQSNSLYEIFTSLTSKDKILIKNANNEEHHFTISSFYLVQDDMGFEDIFIVRLNDVTQIETMKIREMEQTKMASIGKLAAGITHEINTPLTYVMGNIELLDMEVNDINLTSEQKKEIDELLSSIQDGLHRMKIIVDSMRELSSASTSGKMKENVNLFNTLLVSCRMVYNRSKQISPIYINNELFTLEMKKDRYVFPAKIDPNQIEQLWIILLNNALDQLQNSHLDYEKRKIEIFLSKCNNINKIIIKDNGGGIPEQIKDKIFSPFISTKQHGGIGLGLNIAKSIVEKHGGEIFAENDQEGAVFSIIL